MIVKRGKKYFEELEKELVKQLCQKLEDAPRNLGAEAERQRRARTTSPPSWSSASSKWPRRSSPPGMETNRISGKVDKSYVEVPVFKYDQETRLAAAKALNEKTGSFKGWADDAKSELNAQLKKQIEEALNIAALQGFPGFAAVAAAAGLVSAAAGIAGAAARPRRRPPAPPRRRRCRQSSAKPVLNLNQPGGQAMWRPPRMWQCRCGTVSPPSGPLLMTSR